MSARLQRSFRKVFKGVNEKYVIAWKNWSLERECSFNTSNDSESGKVEEFFNELSDAMYDMDLPARYRDCIVNLTSDEAVISEICDDLLSQATLAIRHFELRKENEDRAELEKVVKSQVGKKGEMTIYNFTSSPPSAELLTYLKSGFKHIPVQPLYHKPKQYSAHVREELNSILMSLARSMGFRTQNSVPDLRSVSGLELLRYIGSHLCVTDMRKLEQFYEVLMEKYSDSLDLICQTEKVVRKMGPDVLEEVPYVPPTQVALRADKNVGIALVPLQWLYEEQVRQVRLGNYQEVKESPQQLISKMNRLRDAIVKGLSPAELEVWKVLHRQTTPRDRQAIGLLRIQPKVLKYGV